MRCVCVCMCDRVEMERGGVGGCMIVRAGGLIIVLLALKYVSFSKLPECDEGGVDGRFKRTN